MISYSEYFIEQKIRIIWEFFQEQSSPDQYQNVNQTHIFIKVDSWDQFAFNRQYFQMGLHFDDLKVMVVNVTINRRRQKLMSCKSIHQHSEERDYFGQNDFPQQWNFSLGTKVASSNPVSESQQGPITMIISNMGKWEQVAAIKEFRSFYC